MAANNSNMDQINEFLDRMNSSLKQASGATSVLSGHVGKLNRDLGRMAANVEKWAGKITAGLVSAFGLSTIIKEMNELAHVTTDYIKVAGALTNSISEVTNSINDMKDSTAYYSDTAGAKIIAVMLAQSQGMRANMRDAVGLAKDLKQLYLTTDQATQAAQKYAAVFKQMPSIINDLRAGTLDTYGTLLSAEAMGLDPNQIMEMIQEQIALDVAPDLTTFSGALRYLVRGWDDFKERLKDVAIILARALGDPRFVNTMIKALETLAKLAIQLAKNIAEFINGVNWDKVSQTFDEYIDKAKAWGEWLVKNWKIITGIYLSFKVLLPLVSTLASVLGPLLGKGGIASLGKSIVGLAGKIPAVGATVLGGAGAAVAGGAMGYGTGRMMGRSDSGFEKTAWGVGGIAAGAATGALIGSVVPGVGTVAGALIGGGAAAIGEWLGMSAEKTKEIEKSAGEAAVQFKKQKDVGDEILDAEKQRAKVNREIELSKLRAYLITKEHLAQMQSMLGILQSQKSILDTQYQRAHDLQMNAQSMRDITQKQIANLGQQIAQNENLNRVSMTRIDAMQKQLSTETDIVAKERLVTGIMSEQAAIASRRAENEAKRLEQINTFIKNVEEELAMNRDILQTKLAIAESEFAIKEARSAGAQLTMQERMGIVGVMQATLDQEKQLLAASYARLSTIENENDRRAATLRLDKIRAELGQKQADIMKKQQQQVAEYYTSYKSFIDTSVGSIEAQYTLQSKMNAGLSFSTKERVANVQAQREGLDLLIKRQQLQASMAAKIGQETGNWEPARQAQENLNALVNQRASLIDKNVNATKEYYAALQNALSASLGVAQAELELAEKANLGLGVNIAQRMQVYGLEKKTIDMRKAELNERLAVIQSMTDAGAKKEAMIELEKDHAQVIRDEAGLIDKMKISMEDYLDAFSAASAGATEAFSKTLNPLQDADRLMQQFSGGVGSLSRGMTGANMQREMQAAMAGNVRSQLQVGGFYTQDVYAGGRGYVPAEMLSTGAAMGTAAAGGPMVGNQYWGQDLTGAALTPGGPGPQGIGPLAGRLYPGGVAPGVQAYQGMGGSTPTTWGYGRVQQSARNLQGLPGANPAQFGAQVLSGARRADGGAGAAANTMIFHVYGNRADMETKVISILKENFNPGGYPSSSNK